MTTKLENESITFRISGDILLALRQLTEEGGMSLNTLVNNVLRSYIDWESIAVKAGFGVFQKDVIREAISCLDESTLAKIAANNASAYKDMLLVMKGSHDLDSFIITMKDRSKRAGFNIREFEEPGGKKIIVQHDMGANWSIYSKAYYERVINSIGYPAKIETTDNSIVIFIPKEKQTLR
jgi:hypothetical protein